MRFKSIAIENVFSYHGLKHFDFEKKDEPIALIIGENGFGKTSFINSVKIALHGLNKDILHIGNQTLSKEDFVVGNVKKNFSGMLNRKAKLAGINEAKITITIDDDDLLIVKRTFTLSGSSYVESLMLYDEEQNLLAQGDDAQDIINQKISPTMARFFFFDGEKIQTIADFSHEEFTKMLEDVLELDIYDQMIADAEHLIRKINKAELDKKLIAEVEEKETLYDNIKAKIVTTEESLAHEKKVILKEMEEEQRALNNKLKKLKSRFQTPLYEAKETLTKTLETRQTLIAQMKQVTLVQLPLLLNNKLHKKLSKDIGTNYRGKVQIDTSLLQTKKEQLMQLLEKMKEKDAVSTAFDSIFQPSSANQSVSFADPFKIEKQFDALPKIDLKKLLSSLSSNAQEIKDLENEIASLEHKIAEDKKEYAEDFVLATQINENIIRQTVKCENLEEKILSLNVEEKVLRKELAKLTMQEHKNALANAKLQTLRSIITVSTEMKQKIKKDKRENLERSINIKFKQLKKEGYEADKIILDENFNINLYDAEGNAMDILSSSSGQKQIIATALIWGISEYIAEDIPMIIDTPLGRLDEKNQSLILNEFYPEVSKQVIILPTPSELKHEGFKTLTKYVSQTFILSNAGSATSVEEADIHDIIHKKSSEVT
ncbi:MAG: AAA family ATPase [Sulfurovum sp.]|nr:AAA family ATPase [Sulfurovum sp.]